MYGCPFSCSCMVSSSQPAPLALALCPSEALPGSSLQIGCALAPLWLCRSVRLWNFDTCDSGLLMRLSVPVLVLALFRSLHLVTKEPFKLLGSLISSIRMAVPTWLQMSF